MSSQDDRSISPRTQALLANKDSYIAQLLVYLNKTQKKHALIFLAIYEGDDDLVSTCLNLEHERLARDNDGFSPLTCAVNSGDRQMVRIILSSGLSINEQDDMKRTALWQACYLSNLSMVQYLLSQGAQVTQPEKQAIVSLGQEKKPSPHSILDAVFARTDVNQTTTVQILEALFSHGFQVDSWNLLQKMVQVRMSLKHIAHFVPVESIRLDDSYTLNQIVINLFSYQNAEEILAYFEPLHDKLKHAYRQVYVEAAGSKDVALLNHLEPFVDDKCLVRSICKACESNAERAYMMFFVDKLKNKPQSSWYADQCDPITFALKHDDFELAQLMYDRGFVPTMKTCKECTSEFKKFKWVVDHISFPDSLFNAFFNQYVEDRRLYDYLVSAGFDSFPNFIKARQYALYKALQYGINDWARFLLSVGADPSETNYQGKNAFDIAVDSKNEQGVQMLLAHGLAQRRDSVE